MVVKFLATKEIWRGIDLNKTKVVFVRIDTR